MTGHSYKLGDLATDGVDIYRANADGVLCFADGDPIPAPEDCTPTGERAAPIDVCERVAADYRMFSEGSVHIDPPVDQWVADVARLDPPTPGSPVGYVQLDAGHGDVWEPTQGDYDQSLALANAVDVIPTNIRARHAVIASVIAAQLAEDKELRPTPEEDA